MKKFKIETKKDSKVSYRGERMSVILGRAKIYIIQNDLGFIIDVYSRNKGNEFIDSMQVFYEAVEYSIKKTKKELQKIK